jgi:hypothetical protein
LADDTTAADNAGLTPKRTLTLAEVEQRQVAAIKGGLYVRAEAGRRQRNYRSGRLLTRLLAAFAERGRPLSPLQVPLARAWCQMETLASDAYAALQAGGGGDKAMALYLSLRRGQLSYSISLGMSPTSETSLARDLAGLGKDLEGIRAQRALEDRYVRHD